MQGEVTIEKRFQDGTRETIFLGKNIVTEGFGQGIAHLWADEGSVNIEDFRIKFAQIGTGEVAFGTVSSIYNLSAALEFSDYGPDASLAFNKHDQLVLHGQLLSGSSFETSSDQAFIELQAEDISMVNGSAVEFHFILDNTSIAGIVEVKELGLFMVNPRGKGNKEALLSAYKVLTNTFFLRSSIAYDIHVFWLLYQDL